MEQAAIYGRGARLRKGLGIRLRGRPKKRLPALISYRMKAFLFFGVRSPAFSMA